LEREGSGWSLDRMNGIYRIGESGQEEHEDMKGKKGAAKILFIPS
jgi:hypothetical protein